MSRLTLFEFAARGMKAQAEINKLCHRDDPITSDEAAEKMVKSGKFHYSIEQVRQAIKRYLNAEKKPDFTPKEVAKFISIVDRISYYELYIMIQKRKSILKNQAFIEETDIVRDGCAVWRLV